MLLVLDRFEEDEDDSPSLESFDGDADGRGEDFEWAVATFSFAGLFLLMIGGRH